MKSSFHKRKIPATELEVVTTSTTMDKLGSMKPIKFAWTQQAEEVFEVLSVEEIQNTICSGGL
jgi:hypothetical protein